MVTEYLKKYQCFTGKTIKIIALVTMLIDHMTAGLFEMIVGINRRFINSGVAYHF